MCALVRSAMLSDSTDEAREASRGPFFINLEWDTSLLDLDSKICQLQTELMSQIQQVSDSWLARLLLLAVDCRGLSGTSQCNVPKLRN